MRDLLRLRSAGFRFRGSPRAVLESVDLTIREGDRILIRGPSGSGKSTLLLLMAGLAPEYVSGVLSGTVERLYRSMGVVLQNPEAQIITPTVEEEIAFSLENDGMPASAIRARTAEILDRLGISHLAKRHPLSLSGGECQRVSLASALAREPEILFLDEPTSYLDPDSSGAFFEALRILPERTAVVVVEHRIEAAAAFCARAWEVVPGGGLVSSDFRTYPLPEGSRTGRANPSVGIGLEDPADLPGLPSAAVPTATEAAGLGTSASTPTAPPALEVRGLSHSFEGLSPLFRNIDLTVPSGRIAALTGPSGCGKTTLLAGIARILNPGSGSIRIAGRDSASMNPRDFHSALLYIPQNPEHMFVAETVRAELGLSGPAAFESAERYGLDGLLDRNPYRLSEGEKRRLNLCIALAERRPLYLLDEPTYGLDDTARSALVRDLGALAESGAGVLFVSHDEEFVFAVSDTVYRMRDGAVRPEESCHAGALKSA